MVPLCIVGRTVFMDPHPSIAIYSYANIHVYSVNTLNKNYACKKRYM